MILNQQVNLLSLNTRNVSFPSSSVEKSENELIAHFYIEITYLAKETANRLSLLLETLHRPIDKA